MPGALRQDWIGMGKIGQGKIGQEWEKKERSEGTVIAGGLPPGQHWTGNERCPGVLWLLGRLHRANIGRGMTDVLRYRGCRGVCAGATSDGE